MKSKISFFNRGISRNLFRRFWPLWAVYLALLLLLVPGTQSPLTASIRDGADIYLDANIVEFGIALVYISALVGVAAAMAMFHYLYQARSCGMMNTLPVRRETMFCTAWLTGLVPLLLADLFTMLLTALLLCPGGYASFRALLDWLALVVMGNVTFYGFAVFCAMLTGSLLILPVVYVLLNFAAVVYEGTARALLQTFVFGMVNLDLSFDFLSPVVQIAQKLDLECDYRKHVYTLAGLDTLAVYCAVGLALSAAALLLYRRRRMESATDVVAIPALKPVFKYCLSFGTALVFAVFMGELFFFLESGRSGNPWIVLILLLIGAFLGYFAAEMLLQKTLRVFRGHWRGFFAACAALALFVGVFEFDLTGYERRVPEAEQVESVEVRTAGDGVDLADPAEIAAALELHRAIISRKADCDIDNGTLVSFRYLLKNGREMARSYLLPTETGAEPDPLLRQAEALLNSPSAILSRVQKPIPVDRRTINISRLELGGWHEDEETDEPYFAYSGYELSEEEAVSLYREGLLPDAENGGIGRMHLVTDADYYENAYPIEVRIDLRREDADGHRSYSYISVEVERDSVNTLRWLEEHTDLELRTYAELGINDAG